MPRWAGHNTNLPQESAYLDTFTEEILNGKLHFLCSVNLYFGGSTAFKYFLLNNFLFKFESKDDSKSMFVCVYFAD